MQNYNTIKSQITHFFGILDDFLERVYNSISFNGFYIIFSLVFPLLLIAIGAGDEIFRVLMNRGQYFNNILIDISFFILSFSLWIVPALSIYIFKRNIFGTNHTIDHERKAFQKLSKIYNGVETSSYTTKQIAVRYLATLPFLLFIAGLFYMSILNNLLSKISSGITVGGLFAKIITFFLLFFLFYGVAEYVVKKIYKKKLIIWKMIAIYIITVLLYSFTVLPNWNNEELKWTDPLFYFDYKIDIDPYFLFLSHSFAFFFSYFFLRSNELMAQEKNIEQLYKSAKSKHLVLMVLLVVVLFIFGYLNRSANLGLLSPIVVAIFLVSLLIIFIEFFVSAPSLLISLYPETKTKSLKRMALKFALLVLVGFFLYNFFQNINPYFIRTTPTTLKYERENLEDYFDRWVADRKVKEGDTLNVYLVSGQGGGSRAGAWLLLNMLNLDQKDSTFYKNTFSISTVSGSTSGANMFLAIQDLKENFNQDSVVNRQLKPFDITKAIYNRNYVNGALYGVFGNDMMTNNDRNTTLQQEEKRALKNYFEEHFQYVDDGLLTEKQIAKAQKIADKKIEKSQKVIENFFESDYMNPYKNFSTKTPLFLINATVATTGVKAIFSPVKSREKPTGNMLTFLSAVDLYGNFSRIQKEDSMQILPLVACVNQSQAFPLANSYNFMKPIGRICDGGAIENTGIGTTVELYKELVNYREKIESRHNFKINFVFINILSAKVHQLDEAKFRKSSPLDILKEVVVSVFNSSEPEAIANQEKIKYKQDTIIPVALGEEVALTRMLSDQSLERMFGIMKSKTSLKNTKVNRKILDDLPSVYIQANVKNGKFLESIKSKILHSKKYTLKPEEIFPKLPLSQNQIRYFNIEDEKIADRLVTLLGNSFVTKSFIDTNAGSRVPLNQVEIWMVEKK